MRTTFSNIWIKTYTKINLKISFAKWWPFCLNFNALTHCPLVKHLCINNLHHNWLTHWGRVTHICVSKLITIGSDNGLSPGRHQAIIWTNAGILLIGPFSEISIEIYRFSFKKIHLKMFSGKWRPSCLGLNVLNDVLLSILCQSMMYHC